LPKHVLVPLIVASALFMQQLDATALATSLPVIAAALGETPLRLHLAITVYMFSLAAFLPVSGWVADRYGARNVFRVAIVIFTVASVLCGLATNLEWLLAARFFQGIGGAMMVPVARLILVRSVEKTELVRAMAVMSMPALIGPISGPIVGGFLTSFASWRWIFWINVPVGILGILLVTIFIKDVREPPRRFDAVGALTSSVGLCALLFGIDSAATEERLSILSLACLCLGTVALLAYSAHARKAAEPILDLTLFRVPTFRTSMSGSMLFRAGTSSLPFLLPLLFQQEFGYTPFQSGLITFVAAVGSLGMRTVSSRVISRFGFRSVLIWNGLIAAVLTGACALLRPDTLYLVMLSILFFGGVFRSLQFIGLNALTFADLSHAQMSHATSLSTMVQRLTQSMGIAISAFILHATTTAGVPGLDAFMLVFFIMAAMAASASLLFARLHADAGAELAGRKPPAPDVADPT
jgi:EmrB/QacA subfamily drug resistance transporter